MSGKNVVLSLAFVGLLLACWESSLTICAESSIPSTAMTGPVSGPLFGLEQLQPGRSLRSSSSDIWDWEHGNSDARAIQPGQTLVIADLDGPGRIQHIWNTIAAKEKGAPRLVVIRMYWDDEEAPSVEAPLGDFFVVGHGIDRAMQSLPVAVSSEGRARNCYWPMPFRKSARITITNEGSKPVQAFYYYVDWRKLPALPDDTPYFHAHYRQEYPTTSEQNYLLADIEGRGHYVGTVLNVRQRTGGWFGEGDDFFYIDGEKEPSLRGTGTEDYFCDAWGFREFCNPFYGVPVFDQYKPNGLITAYRWHIPDPISFHKSLRVEIEHKGAAFDEQGEVRSGYEPRADDFASVAYWYQLEPHKPFPPLPKPQDRLYRVTQETTEAEDMLNQVKASAGDLERQAGGQWSNNAQLFWRPMQKGESLEVPFSVQNSGPYDITLTLTNAKDYGTYQVALNGKIVEESLDLYSPSIITKKYALPTKTLEPGKQLLMFRNLGKSAKSTGYFFGLDAIIANRVE